MEIKKIAIMGAAAIFCTNSVLAAGVASVDTQKVLAASAKVAALQKKEAANDKELYNFLETANKEIAKVSDVKKKEDLQNKYSKQLSDKKEKMAKEHVAQIKKIDEEISKVIADQAKAKGYDMVITKGVVLYSANDITEDVVKAVKSIK